MLIILASDASFIKRAKFMLVFFQIMPKVMLAPCIRAYRLNVQTSGFHYYTVENKMERKN